MAQESAPLLDDAPSDQTLSELQEIKARTFYRMVEDIDSKRRLIFLTNKQAELVATSVTTMDRMLDALEMPKPQLVIQLLPSLGHHKYRESIPFPRWRAPGETHNPLCPGIVIGDQCVLPPFLTEGDEQHAMHRLDAFMSDVLIPLAASTNAVVLTNATECQCMLSSSFLRMTHLQSSRWRTPPFTTISMLTPFSLCALYANDRPGLEWHEVRRRSFAWKQRDAEVKKCVEAAGFYADAEGTLTGWGHDLDARAMIYLVVDGIGPEGRMNGAPYNKLAAALVRNLAASLPSLALKTGMSWRYGASREGGGRPVPRGADGAGGHPTHPHGPPQPRLGRGEWRRARRPARPDGSSQRRAYH